MKVKNQLKSNLKRAGLLQPHSRAIFISSLIFCNFILGISAHAEGTSAGLIPASARLANVAAQATGTKDDEISKKASRVDFYEIRRKSDTARGRVDGFGLVIRTQIEGDHYVVNWSLASGARSDGNAKIDFQDSLKEFKNALQAERLALHQVFGDPKTQNELIFAADIIGRYELVKYTLDALGSLSSFDAATEWALRSHVVISLAPQCATCTRSSLIVKLEHFDPARFDWDASTEKEVVKINVEKDVESHDGPALSQEISIPDAEPKSGSAPMTPIPPPDEKTPEIKAPTQHANEPASPPAVPPATQAVQPVENERQVNPDAGVNQVSVQMNGSGHEDQMAVRTHL